MSNEMDINHTTVELSQEELDGISGGISIFLSGSMFEKRDIFSAQRGSLRRRNSRTNSISQSSNIFSSSFQAIAIGLNSPSDIISFVSGLVALFGRR